MLREVTAVPIKRAATTRKRKALALAAEKDKAALELARTQMQKLDRSLDAQMGRMWGLLDDDTAASSSAHGGAVSAKSPRIPIAAIADAAATDAREQNLSHADILLAGTAPVQSSERTTATDAEHAEQKFAGEPTLGALDRCLAETEREAAEMLRDEGAAAKSDGGELQWLTQNVQRALVRAAVESEGLVRQQKDSYEKFMSSGLAGIVHENSAVIVDSDAAKRRHVVEFKSVVVSLPTQKEASGLVRPVYPYECRARGLTYGCQVSVDVEHKVYDLSKCASAAEYAQAPICETKVYRELPLATLPAMVGTRFCRTTRNGYMNRECPLDEGGYFIINGAEKVMVDQQKMRPNVAYLYREKADSKYKFKCETRSAHESKVRSTSTLYCFLGLRRADGLPEVEVELPYMKQFKIPLVAFFKGIGVMTRAEMAAYILQEPPHPTREGELRELVDVLLSQDTTSDDVAELYEWIGKHATLKEPVSGAQTRGAGKDSTREKRIKIVDNLFQTEFLPHIGMDRDPETMLRKRFFLGHMVLRLCQAHLFKDVKPDDRDDQRNHRVDTTGQSLAAQLRPAFRDVLSELARGLKNAADRDKYINLFELISPRTITGSFKYAMATGKWGVQKGNAPYTGVCQQHSRLTYAAGISNLRRVHVHLPERGKQTKPRQLHISQDGIMCPVESPEGKECGLIKNLTLLAHVRLGYPSTLFIQLILPLVVPLADPSRDAEQRLRTRVFVGGIPLGTTRDAPALLQRLRAMRVRQTLPPDCSIFMHRTLASVEFDHGTVLRPLLRVDRLADLPALLARHTHRPPQPASAAAVAATRADGAALVTTATVPPCAAAAAEDKTWEAKTSEAMPSAAMAGSQGDRGTVVDAVARGSLWTELRASGLVELIDKAEEEGLRVAKYVRELGDREEMEAEPYTHLELHPSMMFGVIAALIPFPDHNQAPRNMYQSAMGKQSMAMVGLNLAHRFDGTSRYMLYPERPLVRTMAEDLFNRDTPQGFNAWMAIMTLTGYNQEDSAIINLSAVQRGLLRNLRTQTYKLEEKGRQRDATCITRPDPLTCRTLRHADYSQLQENGVPLIGAQLTPNSIVIGAVHSSPDPENKQRMVERCASQMVKLAHGEVGFVDKVIWTKNKDGRPRVEVSVSTMRMPSWGDKFCLTQEHDVLTQRGWVPIQQLSLRDAVATLDAATLQFTYEPPQAVVAFNHHGLVLPGPLTTTLDHRALTADAQFVLARQLARGTPLLSASRGLAQTPSTPTQQTNAPARVEMACLDDSESVRFKSPELKEVLMRGRHVVPSLPSAADALAQRATEQELPFTEGVGARAARIAQWDAWQKAEVEAGRCAAIVGDWRGGRAEQAVQDCIEQEDYKGGVWCVTTRTGAFCARARPRIGHMSHAVWTGNSSRHGQKNTCGLLLRDEDMPFTADGRRPDIIINPHGFPSRMTVGKMIEALMGKACAMTGEQGDGTAFGPVTVEDVQLEVERLGWVRSGKEIMYNGMTGERLEAQIFFAPCFYQPLRHVASEKMHGRARGPVNKITGQPVDGRGKNGGLRMGEMERDCMIGYGAPYVMQDRLCSQSDPFVCPFCAGCGRWAEPARPADASQVSLRTPEPYCRACERSDTVRNVHMSKACLVLLYELAAASCDVRVTLSDQNGRLTADTDGVHLAPPPAPAQTSAAQMPISPSMILPTGRPCAVEHSVSLPTAAATAAIAADDADMFAL